MATKMMLQIEWKYIKLAVDLYGISYIKKITLDEINHFSRSFVLKQR